MTTLVQSIARNRRKHARWARCERVLRSVRLQVFDFEDQGRDAKARRVIETCNRLLSPKWDAERRTRQAARLERTPSAFEPGLHGR